MMNNENNSLSIKTVNIEITREGQTIKVIGLSESAWQELGYIDYIGIHGFFNIVDPEYKVYGLEIYNRLQKLVNKNLK